MNDSDMAAWRARRMAEMQAGAGGGGGGGGGSSAARQQQQQQQQQKQAAEEEQRRLMLAQLLSPAASERLSRIRLVKPMKARQVEEAVIGAARAGRISGPLDEEGLKALLQQFAAVNERKPSITITRRNTFDADDSD
eukprot:TRINITY_DN9229_c0_g1_i1.p3 TRINITY_DN9229_c0_g1~~TRINITY_DN9229_c0_g1_i1.p3  ORF type:complete len:137 (-),score=75.03 TRINITY_DN9229_c0_g1_i1:308-718(-)